MRGVDDDAHARAAKAIVGAHFDLLAANWRSEAFSPAWYVGADHALGWIVVSIRGTLDLQDILTDLSQETVPFDFGFIHHGVVRAAHHVFAAVQLALDAVR